MLVNARRRRRRRRNRPNPFAGVNRPRRRRRSRRRNPFASANMPRRRRGRRRSYRRNQPARVPRTIQQFLSAAFLTDVAFAGLGAITPSWVTDRLLPMMGPMFDLRGMPMMRRLVQFAVPTVALWFAPRGFGKQAGSFAIGAYAVTAVGLINDFTGGMVGQLGAYEPSAPISGLGRYELSAPGVGMNEDEAEVLYAE